MSRLQGLIELLVYSDTDITNNPQLRNFDQRRVLSDDSISSFPSPNLVAIPDATVDKVIDFHSITAEYLFIFTDQEITIKINGGSESFKISEFIAWKGEFTALSISNASGAVANVTIGFGA